MSLNLEGYKSKEANSDYEIIPVGFGMNENEEELSEQESDTKMSRKEIMAKLKEILGNKSLDQASVGNDVQLEAGELNLPDNLMNEKNGEVEPEKMVESDNQKYGEQIFEPEIYEEPLKEVQREEKGLNVAEQLVDPDLIPDIPVPDFLLGQEEVKNEMTEEKVQNLLGIETEKKEDEVGLRKDLEENKDNIEEDFLGPEIVDKMKEDENEILKGNEQEINDENEKELIFNKVEAKEQDKNIEEKEMVDLPQPMEFEEDLSFSVETENKLVEKTEGNEKAKQKIEAALEDTEILEENEKNVEQEVVGKDWLIQEASRKQEILKKLSKLKEINQDLLKRMR